MQESLHPEVIFAEAAEAWVNSRTMSPGSRARYISPRTLSDLQQYIRALNRKFGPVPLNEIDIGLLREYQRERSETCGANKINQEMGALVRIMKRAGTWTHQLNECYERLQPQEADVARAMTPEEQKMFLQVASSREEWQFVYCYALLALATSASNCEMRGLRLGDINLYSKVLHIRREHAKNRYRIRTIPMHDEAVWAVTRLMERARGLGAVESASSPHAVSRHADFMGSRSAHVEKRHPQGVGDGSRSGQRALAANPRSSSHSHYANGRSRRSHSGNPQHGRSHQHTHATALHISQRVRETARCGSCVLWRQLHGLGRAPAPG